MLASVDFNLRCNGGSPIKSGSGLSGSGLSGFSGSGLSGSGWSGSGLSWSESGSGLSGFQWVLGQFSIGTSKNVI